MLFDVQLFRHITGSAPFCDDENTLYRLQADATPLVLNMWRIWADRVDDNPVGTVLRCKKALSSIVKDFSAPDENGELKVDYDSVALDPRYEAFEESVCEIQCVDMTSMSPNERTAFCINLYNMMIVHAFAKLGRPESSRARLAFFSNVSYMIGGELYSFSDIENGILRGNKVPPYSFSRPFRPSDRRFATALDSCECKVHFALNCGAHSCPPVKNFTRESVVEELQVVARAFCEDEENVRISVEDNTVWLSQIFSWYSSDFGSSRQMLLQSVLGWLRGEKKEKLSKLIESGVTVKTRSLHYDWTTNAMQSGSKFGDKDLAETSRADCTIF